MYELNKNFFKFPGGYLFATVRNKMEAYQKEHPEAAIISLGIGDVTQPLAPSVVAALQKAVLEMGQKETFRGYGPYQGYTFLREAIAAGDFAPYGADISADEIYINDGAKSDVGNIIELFSENNYIAICEPTYPAYVDTNVIAGKAGDYNAADGTWSNIMFLPCTEKTGFVPEVPSKADRVPALIYLCYPNNPTGVMMTKPQLQEWVDYANRHGSIILYDSAYVEFIETPGAPHTIYECEGAKHCAIEMRSYSKTAGFTGMRMGYTVIPKELGTGKENLNRLWLRRQGTKYNGAPYIIQRAAEAVYTPEGRKETRAQIAYYKKNTKVLRDGLREMGYTAYGGVDSPYVWMKTPAHMTSWEFFDLLLEKANVIGTPGAGFGPSGEGYFRLTGFGDYENAVRALERIRRL